MEQINQPDISGDKSSKKIIFAIFAFLVLLAFVGGALFYFFSFFKEEQLPNNPLSPNGSISSNESERRFLEIGKKYDSASNPVSVGGKLAYVAEASGREFVVYGKELSKEYDSIQEVKDIGGKLAFTALNNKKWLVVFDGKEIASDQLIISPLKEIGGKIAFNALGVKENGETEGYMQYGDEKIIKEYDYVSEPVDINGKLAYLTSKNGRHFLVYDGKKLGKEYGFSFNLMPIGNAYAFLARYIPGYTPEDASGAIEADGHDDHGMHGTEDLDKQLKGKTILIYNGEEIGLEYDQVSEIFNLGGKLLFVAFKNAERKHYLVYNDRVIGQQYDLITNLVDVNDRLSFIAYQGNGMVIDNDGKKIGFIEDYDSDNTILFLENINNKLAYVVKWKGETYVIYDDTEVGIYDDVRVPVQTDRSMIGINDKLVFAAQKGDKYVLVYDREEIASYDNISHLIVLEDNQLAFSAEEWFGGVKKRFIVVEK